MREGETTEKLVKSRKKQGRGTEKSEDSSGGGWVEPRRR